MRRSAAGSWWAPTAEGVPALVVTAAFFTLGGLAGCLMALSADDAGAQALKTYLDGFLDAAGQGALSSPGLMALLWHSLRWHLGAFLLGYTALGLVGVPVLTGLRGFLLGFSISSFARAYGAGGLTAALVLLGLPGMIAVPVFFLLSVQSLSAAFQLAAQRLGWGGRGPVRERTFYLRCGVCAAAAGAALLLERFLVPPLIAGWAEVLLR